MALSLEEEKQNPEDGECQGPREGRAEQFLVNQACKELRVPCQGRILMAY